jgi:hypothetical protein
MKVVFAALASGRRKAVRNEMAWVADHGDEVQLVTIKREVWPEIDDRIKVIELTEGEGRHPIPRSERVLVFRIPRLLFGGPAQALSAFAKVPVAGLPAKALLPAARAVQRAQERVSMAVHTKVYLRFYKIVRPYILWRVARRDAVPHLGMDGVDLLIVTDAAAIPLGWHLARRYPELKVHFSLDRSIWENRRPRELSEPA